MAIFINQVEILVYSLAQSEDRCDDTIGSIKECRILEGTVSNYQPEGYNLQQNKREKCPVLIN